MSTMDRWGGAVALTSTVNLIFGSRVMDAKTGIILNDELDDFATPGIPDAFGLRRAFIALACSALVDLCTKGELIGAFEDAQNGLTLLDWNSQPRPSTTPPAASGPFRRRRPSSWTTPRPTPCGSRWAARAARASLAPLRRPCSTSTGATTSRARLSSRGCTTSSCPSM